MIEFTVATPTYNRADTLYRVYDSLCNQSIRNFEWLIVDDGSEDNTAEVVQQWVHGADFPIRYYYQENGGKHTALNVAVEKAKGKYFVIADSDDSFVSNALEIMLQRWLEIPENIRNEFRGVTCRCYDPETKKGIGCEFPNGIHDVLGIEGVFKYHYNFEMWGFNRIEIMKEFPFPDTRGKGLAFYPETVIWNRMGLKYKVRYINDSLRAYYRDQENATTNKKRNRSKENIHLWVHYLNDVLPYFFYDPKLFVKAFVGLSMDGFLLNKSFSEIIAIPKSIPAKLGVMLFMPVGWIMYQKRK